MEQIKIAAGIVLYNPESERLRQNIEAILPQVDALFLVDNGSVTPIEVNHGLLIRNEQNLGIAKALNQLMTLAEEQGFDWMLTLDQDSICPSQLIATMRPYAQSEKQAGILCPVIVDRSYGIEHQPSANETLTPVQECITSASLTRVKAWREVGGFDDRLFIDAVDTDFCLSLHEHGWKVLRVNTLHLLHEIGHRATQHRVLGRCYIAFNHAPIRYYFMARNMVFLSRKHPGFLKPAPWRCLLTMMARMLVVLLWEKEGKLSKCRQIVRGCREGMRMRC